MKVFRKIRDTGREEEEEKQVQFVNDFCVCYIIPVQSIIKCSNVQCSYNLINFSKGKKMGGVFFSEKNPAYD